MTRLHRRDFLKSCCVAAGGVGSRARAYFAPPPIIPTTATSDTLVIVFLRGAMDGLSLLPPGASSPFRADYEANRTNTRVPTTGTGAALALPNTTWALHPRATALQALYQQN
ncbi:MAG TPA: twin-arginine translocation signal domain-containing protein, partial [Rhodanobacteraceae bacterium]|nr:twin-arginine translocation signal domain-containing protein [Rhodanobacteraceae bacterium]